MDQTEALPDDTLASILGRLPPCDLAASRCVRKTWRAVVDARRLLLPHLLPHSLHGIFINYIDYESPRCFSRPSTQKPAIDCNLDFLPGYAEDFDSIVDHCNGLLLYESDMNLCSYVVNPATRQWERLRYKTDARHHLAYLAFDPAVSPHYEVLLIPCVPDKVDPAQDSMEWPPSSWVFDVFSSSTRKWLKRSFIRQGEAAGTVTDVRVDPLQPKSMCWGGPRRRYSAYWRGSLYVHCRGAFVVRSSMSDGKYQVIKMPIDIVERKQDQYLGKSEKGVYLAAIIYDEHILQVKTLVESSRHIDWVLKYHVDLEPCATADCRIDTGELEGFEKTWTLDGGRREGGWGEADEEKGEGENGGMLIPKNLEWDSDDDNVLNGKADYGCFYGRNVYFLGFHPYKEVVFLGLSFTGMAYHLESSKVQYLGDMRPKDYYHGHANGIYDSFPYTPCMIGELRNHASRSRRRGWSI
ncbi:hypothetical protein CFC21_061119 [Triticum aestivum]|uniref:F-box domain-containing protein n=2 Tax=Triticum aestivum TaxID=4565 RepID=A0A9R1KGG7_WHEAT|nr:F-box protein At5g07610-like [Triticum aestivum]KAF7053135.1 hypothetical protein CFC21_061119 [Triticum aestivum]